MTAVGMAARYATLLQLVGEGPGGESQALGDDALGISRMQGGILIPVEDDRRHDLTVAWGARKVASRRITLAHGGKGSGEVARRPTRQAGMHPEPSSRSGYAAPMMAAAAAPAEARLHRRGEGRPDSRA